MKHSTRRNRTNIPPPAAAAWVVILAIVLAAVPVQASVGQAASVAPPAELSALPDLVITDVWSDQGQICYQIQNIGNGASPGGHETVLYLDGQNRATDLIQTELAPEQRLTRCFSLKWVCTPPQQKVLACANAFGKVTEASTDNNCREELWKCDNDTPLIISGPTVSDITQTSALVKWNTDEDGDSQVEYDEESGLFGMQESSQQPSTYHQTKLTGLKPSTVYQYRVRSADPSGNVVVSKPGFFETLPAEDGVPPTLSAFTIDRVAGDALRYKVSVPASDNICLERVELYLDGQLVGTDYAPSSKTAGVASGQGGGWFEFDVLPGVIGTPYSQFFTKHQVLARAMDCAGTPAVIDLPWHPEPDPFDGELYFLSPEEDYVLYIAGTTAPPGSSLNISVHAVEYEAEECPSWTGDIDCRHRETTVERVEFYVDDDDHPLCISEADQREHSCLWDMSGLTGRWHEIQVKAFAADGRWLSVQRIFEIRAGAARLDVRRTVQLDNDGLLIRLMVDNVGTISTQLSGVRDNLTGFQSIDKSAVRYNVQTQYDPAAWRSDVQIDVFDDVGSPYALAPGLALTIEYRAVPILYPFLFSPAWADRYAIGSDPVTVTIFEGGSFTSQSFSRPATWVEQTVARITVDEAVTAWREGSRYLIITNPHLLFAYDPSTHDVNLLLSDLGELATLKHAILGYWTYSGLDYDFVDQFIENWGGSMTGAGGTAGGYLSDGYLLIVGETRIVPAAQVCMTPWYSAFWSPDDPCIPLTDVYYADTHSNLIDPELMVGRIIGNNARELRAPVQTIIHLERGDAGFVFDRSQALVMSGWPTSRDGGSDNIDFRRERWDVTGYLEDHGTVVRPLHTPDFTSAADAALNFFVRAHDRGIIHMAGHGNPWWLDDVGLWYSWEGADPFGDANPFVYGSSCLTGRYTDQWMGRPIVTSVAESFLLRGAAAYLGATQVSYDPANRNIAGSIYYHWDPGRSIGSVVKEVKIARGTGVWDFIEDFWTVEYQIFGDPQLGQGVYLSTTAAEPASSEAATVPSALTIDIPDYQVNQYEDGEIQVEIPGGFWLQVPGQPMVPTYAYSLHVEQGERVQDVILSERSGLVTATGLDIPIFEPREAGSTELDDVMVPSEGEWWPDLDYEWSVSDNPDGSSELLLQIYPFFYNSLTTDVRFYKSYTFEVRTNKSLAEIAKLTTDQSAYAASERVAIDLWINNPAAAQDITVDARVKALGSGQVVGGLLLRSLKGLTGLATFSLDWNTATWPAGDYYVEADIRDSQGNVLDSQIESFKIGVTAAQTANWTVTPDWFLPGEEVGIAFDVINSGTTPINGLAQIQIHGLSGDVVAEFDQVISDLAPSGSVQVKRTWDTSGAKDSRYHVVATVHYDSTATPPLSATLRNRSQERFFPLVLR